MSGEQTFRTECVFLQSCFPCKLRHTFCCININARKGYTNKKTKKTKKHGVDVRPSRAKLGVGVKGTLFFFFNCRYILPPASFRAYSVLAGFAFLAQLSSIIGIRPDYVLEGLGGGGADRETQRDRETERETERVRDRERQRQKQRETESERDRDRNRERQRQRETETETERDRERQTERQKQR